jgi:hypothetical protein
VEEDFSFTNPREPDSQSAVSTWITADARKEPPTGKPAREDSPAVLPRPTGGRTPRRSDAVRPSFSEEGGVCNEVT